MASRISKVARDALTIWQAGVDSVKSDRVVRQAIEVESDCIIIDDVEFPVDVESRIIVVGAGKAACGMLQGFVEALKDTTLFSRMVGWVNVPGTQPLPSPHPNITIHPSRPLGNNLPTVAALEGTRKIVDLVASAKSTDLVVCLLSGGGSSLLVDPIDGITLEQKIALTTDLSAAGADIHQLNLVRRAISNVKAGGLLRHCGADSIATLVISDVLDDDLATIASGPTCDTVMPEPKSAILLIQRLLPASNHTAQHVIAVLRDQPLPHSQKTTFPQHRFTTILANNATAVDAAGVKAVELGYSYIMMCHRKSEGDAKDVGATMVDTLAKLTNESGIDCSITGGEPTVDLSAITGDLRNCRGGRNQHVVLTAAVKLLERSAAIDPSFEFCLLSGGTDGEDGNSTVAGAWIDHEKLTALRSRLADAESALARFDSYTLLSELDATINTGMTLTNVCDLRVVLVKNQT